MSLTSDSWHRRTRRSGVLQLLASGLTAALLSSASCGETATYREIAAAFPNSQLTKAEIDFAEMQGKCLVGLKDVNFRKQDTFDPVAEWTNYRSLSLLEQFPPCTVLIMMETARKDLLAREDP